MGRFAELAWVLHCAARLAPGGTAVVLMPPAAASRKAGRRIRGALVREGLLRAVIALPPGAAPPHGVAHHLWVLCPAGQRDTGSVLMVDTLGAAPVLPGKGELDWPSVRDAALSAWRGHRLGGSTGEQAGQHRAVPAIDLLTGDVDLTPARHVPPTTAARSRTIARLWDTLDAAHDQSRGASPSSWARALTCCARILPYWTRPSWPAVRAVRPVPGRPHRMRRQRRASMSAGYRSHVCRWTSSAAMVPPSTGWPPSRSPPPAPTPQPPTWPSP